ncbi:MAG TPA: hypothetical protein VLA76_03895 [Candidatus Angelobacter sp.]|nr:hypothetical protein [Candidatus Angelobacter sp.]
MFLDHTPAEQLRAPFSRPVAAAVLAMMLTAFILIAVVIGTLVTGSPAATTEAGAVTDGWQAYLGAAAPAADTNRAADGWASYLLTSTATSEVTDGWLTRFGSR